MVIHNQKQVVVVVMMVMVIVVFVAEVIVMDFVVVCFRGCDVITAGWLCGGSDGARHGQ